MYQRRPVWHAARQENIGIRRKPILSHFLNLFKFNSDGMYLVSILRRTYEQTVTILNILWYDIILL
jgi:hypothetical protein